MNPLIRRPSAWLPIAASLIMLAIFLGFFLMSGPPVPQKDEGVGAHLFQLWLVFEFFAIGFFALSWLPKAPKQALIILAIQIVLVIIVCFPVFYFNL